jgi:hypothetical protein
MSTVSSPGVNRPGPDVDHPPLSNAEFKERVQLYLYSLFWAFVICSRFNLPLLLLYLHVNIDTEMAARINENASVRVPLNLLRL